MVLDLTAAGIGLVTGAATEELLEQVAVGSMNLYLGQANIDGRADGKAKALDGHGRVGQTSARGIGGGASPPPLASTG